MDDPGWEDLADSEIHQRLENRGFHPDTIREILRARYHDGVLPREAVEALEK